MAALEVKVPDIGDFKDVPVIEVMVTQELGDPFRRDALKYPRRVLEKYRHTNVEAPV